jgi:hypothetical protein
MPEAVLLASLLSFAKGGEGNVVAYGLQLKALLQHTVVLTVMGCILFGRGLFWGHYVLLRSAVLFCSHSTVMSHGVCPYCEGPS